jgi:hypothetical protein
MSFRNLSWVLLTLAILIGPLAGDAPLHAELLLGNYLGTFGGNDSESALLDDLGLDVMRLGRVNFPDTTDEGLSWEATELNDDDEPIAGEWTYAGPELVDYLVVKAGSDYAIYSYIGVYAPDMLNMGLWNTDDLDNKGMSHLTAYKLNVPEPAGLALALSAVAGLGVVFRRRR